VPGSNRRCQRPRSSPIGRGAATVVALRVAGLLGRVLAVMITECLSVALLDDRSIRRSG
jgi:hypothetical protein